MANFDATPLPVPLPPMYQSFVNPHEAQTYNATSSSGTASITYYVMRGVIAGNNVYWQATQIDVLAIEYTGGGGTPTSIVLIKRAQ